MNALLAKIINRTVKPHGVFSNADTCGKNHGRLPQKRLPRHTSFSVNYKL